MKRPRDPKRLDLVEVGDVVDLTYTEALAGLGGEVGEAVGYPCAGRRRSVADPL